MADLIWKDRKPVPVLHKVDETTILSCDIIFQILLLVPPESVAKFQLVCKAWSVIINNSVFRNSYHKSETLVLVQHTLERKALQLGKFGVLYADSSTNDAFIKSTKPYYFIPHTSINGLVLAWTPDKRLLLLNPVTRKHITLPMYKKAQISDRISLAYCEDSETYKVVHLFESTKQYFGCEILTVGSKIWTRIDKFPLVLSKRTSNPGVFIGGSLYWVSSYDEILVMDAHNENLSIKNMPTSDKPELINIAGNLGIVFRTSLFDDFEVQVLDKGKGMWRKAYDIRFPAIFGYNFESICCSRDGKEMFLSVISFGRLKVFAYNLVKGEARLIYTVGGNDSDGWLTGNCIPNPTCLE